MSKEYADASDDEMSPELLKMLESTVFAAGKFVVPSDDLRPHTLEAARDYSADINGTYRFAQLILAVFVFVTISLPIFGRLASWRDSVASPTSLQMYEIAMKKNVGMDWGLFEAFSELRQSQASRFGQTNRKNVQD